MPIRGHGFRFCLFSWPFFFLCVSSLRSRLTHLSEIKSPQDIKNLSQKEVAELAAEIRKEIIDVVSKNGGHLSSNLGVVELAIALHRVFDSPKDAIIWDVSHQCYAHKLLTGRYEQFHTLRQSDGISGFTKQSESVHDFFDCGHSSTSISQALGLLTARKMQHIDGKVIAVIGDGAMTGGMAFEALSHAGILAKDLIVVLNDNQMSISWNTGTISRHISNLAMSARYQSFRYKFESGLEKIPGHLGESLEKFNYRFKRGLKGVFFSNNLFVDLGFEYVGPIDGHDCACLERVLKRVKKIRRPVVVHVVTKKGKGFEPAEKDPIKYHGIGPFNLEKALSPENKDEFSAKEPIVSEKPISFTESFSKSLIKVASKDEKVIAITAAMTKGTGLMPFMRAFPDRFYDVGIAEQHAVTFAGGLAVGGMKPVVAIYSTFMQRAFDQLVEDIALQNIPAIFVLDHSGPVEDDGETHQGIFDISMLRPVPNLSLLAPASSVELDLALNWAVEQKLPVVIRYPKAICPSELPEFSEPVQIGRGVLIHYAELKNDELGSLAFDKLEQDKIAQDKRAHDAVDTLFVCTGGIFPEVKDAVNILCNKDVRCDIYNLRFLKPLDKEYFLDVVKDYKYIMFVEDGIRIGGIGTYLESLLQRTYTGKFTAVCGFPNRFVSQGKREDILEKAHLSSSYLATKTLRLRSPGC
ncbi:MAG: 1-deoxy-D-xylulose-5-phosphate synthase [Treponemataceae bacterium]|nr:1-deoxy-D-xylulose-5-phosphate synthase [Spirochaetales bacterium]MDY6031413.1 1-deoxy-D-xylulose-5-phosphate synthase [Treponemataceae bacterium]